MYVILFWKTDLISRKYSLIELLLFSLFEEYLSHKTDTIPTEYDKDEASQIKPSLTRKSAKPIIPPSNDAIPVTYPILANSKANDAWERAEVKFIARASTVPLRAATAMAAMNWAVAMVAKS
jgi:hypothetical protein